MLIPAIKLIILKYMEIEWMLATGELICADARTSGDRDTELVREHSIDQGFNRRRHRLLQLASECHGENRRPRGPQGGDGDPQGGREVEGGETHLGKLLSHPWHLSIRASEGAF